MADRRSFFVVKDLNSSMAYDVGNFPEAYDITAPPVGTDMAGHDTFLLGPKVVLLDSFIVDLLNVDTSAQTFKLKLILNLDWVDDGTIEPETKAKRNLRKTSRAESFMDGESSLDLNRASSGSHMDYYKTGKYIPRRQYIEDPLSTTWNPEVVLVNAIADGDPIEAASKMHSVQMLQGRPVISRKVLYQPECRCEFTYANFPFDETDLVIKFSSNKWSAEQLSFVWSDRLVNFGKNASLRKTRSKSMLKQGVDVNAIGGLGQSEFEIIQVRVETVEKDVNSMQRYDNTEGAFSEAHLIIRVRRDPYSYLLRVGFVSELLMVLEVMSFLTDRGELSDRFSISGTIFLAMVSLYGPMADALPKVSVVTRVDKWHLGNFALLFASNIENLIFFMLRDVINERLLLYFELLLASIYLYLVVKNLLWFIQPLSKRDEWSVAIDLFEENLESLKEKMTGSETRAAKLRPWATSDSKRQESIARLRAVLKTASTLKKMAGKEKSGRNGVSSMKSE
ncbi:hypothetical protein HJC23_012005 [Cyclotella cryptica]|uniref:Neurotransmitter-gated ion-channel ligand-binding domain-containing protein n=1 Tax=Cyclotella cryptica TaxID=29204 RepID=A0ABD3QS12_9STRA|eukprot:CCRYP_003079-RB/>CCRYP_003079-RB protein AED:0.05 eAED:0.05 QI:337/1/1/1/0.8/0.66/6/1283/507